MDHSYVSSFDTRPAASSSWSQIVFSSVNNRNSSQSQGDVNTAMSTIVRTQVVCAESITSVAAASSPSPSTVVEYSSAVKTNLPADDSLPTSESLENDFDESNDNTAKMPVWNKPSLNGATSDVKPVMDACSCPALSNSTKADMRLFSEPSKGLTDVSSVPRLQGTQSPPSSSETQVTDYAKTNTPVPTSQELMRRNGSDASSNGNHKQPPLIEGPTPATGSHNSSPKDNTLSGFASQSHNVNDRPQHQHDSFKNRNGGPNHRGDGSRQQNLWGRREQHRGNQGWNLHRSFNGRNTHMPPRGVPRFTRPQPPPPPPPLPYSPAWYFPPPPVPPYEGPYGGHYGFPELAPLIPYYAAPPPEPFSGVPYMPPIPPHPVHFPAPDPQLHVKIVQQIEYYFSFDNLIKDMFLRKHMDDQGWVPIRLIADFKKVKELTDNTQIIVDALRTSSVVEIQGDKIRPRTEWQRWIVPASFELAGILET